MGELHPSVVKEFRNRPRDNHDWMKTLKNRELNEALRSIGVDIDRCEERLDKHQKVCILLGIMYPGFAFWLDMGLGKTRVALELIRYWIKMKECKVALVIAPFETILFGWEAQIKRFKIKIPYITLPNSSSAEKWDQLAEFEHGIILATFPGITRMVSRPKEQRGKRRKKLTMVPSLIKRLAKMCQAFVMDEAALAANKKSLNWRFCNQVRKYADKCYELTGRPFGKDPMKLWAQLYLVDRGESLGDTLGLFRAAFYEEERGYWGNREYTLKQKYKKVINKIIKHRSIQYSERECGIKFKVRNTREVVRLPKEATSYYEQQAKTLRMAHAGYREQKNAFLRMRQISSGFLGFKNDEDGSRAEVAFAENPKLDMLMDLIEQMPTNRKFVVFHEFVHSGKVISAALTKRGIQHGCLRGGTVDHRSIRRRYDRDPLYKGLVINHKVGAYGMDGLQRVANYCFVYEAPVAPDANEQMRRRLPRKGQDRTVFEYDLVCKGTADVKILNAHKTGDNLFKEIVRGNYDRY